MPADGSPASRRALLASAAAATLPIAVAGCFDGATDADDDSAPDDGSGPEDGDDGATDPSDDADPVPVAVEPVVDGLAHPWSLAFLPDGPDLLVTERPGTLRRVDPDAGTTTRIDGVPAVHAAGQGGLLDVEVHPAYPDDPWVYLTYAATDGDGSATHLARGRLAPDGTRLTDREVLSVAEPFLSGSAHYGSRATFGPDGHLYVTCGDRQRTDFGPAHVSQDLSTAIGSTIRLEPDGSIPEDNPFVDDPAHPDAEPAIYTYGHRNPQGMAVHPTTGAIWQSEHGQRDGDELNVLAAGGNYGWPVATAACEYGTERPIGTDHDEREDVVAPVHHWPCPSGGFPPAGMTFYDGEAFPRWRGDLFVANLAGRYLGRFAVDGTDVTERSPLLEGEGVRVRDVAVAPETGHLYVAVDAADAPIVRLVPG